MRSSIATVCISGTLEEKLDAIAQAGFDGYELFENDLITSTLSPAEVARRGRELGLTLELYQPFRDFEGVDDATLARNLRRAERKFELMGELGTDKMLVCSNVSTAKFGDDARAVDQLGLLADLAARHGIGIAYEALAWGRYVSTYEHAWRIVEEVGHDNLGICLDSFHILSRGSSLDTIDSIPGEKIFFCQLADAPAMSLDVLSWSRHYRLFPGEGVWDLGAFVAATVDAGYTGPLSLEVFNDVFRQSDPFTTARDARRSLVALEDAASARISAARPAVSLSTLPPVSETAGFSFVELAPGDLTETRRFLSALGLRRIGDHRRKNSELWSAGDANIVLNRDRDDAEPTIAAFGVEVSDVDEASRRAVALGSRVLPRDRQNDERVLHAVNTPDGIDLYFSPSTTQNSWVQEFAEGELTQNDRPGIRSIDHIGLLQPWQRADEASLFYRSVLGLAVSDSVDVSSQSGLVRSRSLASADRGVRLALNIAPGSEHGQEQYLNHIALATDDLVGVADRLAASSADVLAIPQNYYDDLDARTGLGAERIARLAAGNILFDEDAEGAFLHLYVHPLGDVLFEIVERVGGYDGYGAANSPVRLAALRVSHR